MKKILTLAKEILLNRIYLKLPLAIYVSLVIPQSLYIGDDGLSVLQFLSSAGEAFFLIFLFIYPLTALLIFVLEKFIRAKNKYVRVLCWLVIAVVLIVLHSDYVVFGYANLAYDRYMGGASYEASRPYAQLVGQYCGIRSKFTLCTNSKLCTLKDSDFGLPPRCSYAEPDDVEIFKPKRKSLTAQFIRGRDRIYNPVIDEVCSAAINWDAIGAFYIKEGNVCYRAVDYYPEIDGYTFERLNRYYAKDKNNVYIFDNSILKLAIADADSFEVIAEVYAKDKNNIYGCAVPIEEVDRDTFEYVGGIYDFAKDKNNVYTTGGTKSDILIPPCKVVKVPGADPNTFDFKKYSKYNEEINSLVTF